MGSAVSRRQLLAAGAGSGPLCTAADPRARAIEDARRRHFPRTWNEAHRNLLAPYFKQRTGASVTQSIQLATDQIAKLTAAKGGQPPFDVAILDEPQVFDAANQGLIAEYPVAKSPNYKDLFPAYPGQVGSEDLDAGDRHRLQPEQDQDAANRTRTCSIPHTRAGSD